MGNGGFNLTNKIVFYLGGNQKIMPFNLFDRTFDRDLTHGRNNQCRDL